MLERTRVEPVGLPTVDFGRRCHRVALLVRVRVRVASQRSGDVRGRDVKNMQESCPEADFKVRNEIYGSELP